MCAIETNDSEIAHCREDEGFEIDKVDPRDWLEGDGIAVEVLTGRFSDAYVLRKT